MISRKQAQEILGVTEKSLNSDVDVRYATLVKRYRAEQNNIKLEEISLAYNILTGRHVELAEEDIRKQSLIFGKTREQWSNIWLYGKFKYALILIAVLFIGYIIYSVINNTPADFKIAAVGQFKLADSDLTMNYAKKLFPEFEKVDVSLAYFSNTDGSDYGLANAQKAMILLTVSGEDLIVVDNEIFKTYAPMGAFKAIDELYDSVISIGQTKALSLGKMKAIVGKDSGGSGTEKIYGINVSQTQLMNAIGIYGTDQIITISVKSKRESLTKDFIIKLFKSYLQTRIIT